VESWVGGGNAVRGNFQFKAIADASAQETKEAWRGGAATLSGEKQQPQHTVFARM